MSLSEFEVVLHPDPFLHRLLMLAGVIAMLLGILIILALPISVHWRWLMAAIWVADCLRELGRTASGCARVRSIRLHATGEIFVSGPDGTVQQLTLRTGSMILPSLAWLRLSFSAGGSFVGLFTRGRTGPEDWHRLQLLWQQSRTSFGHPVGP
jgi:hypothetical protein